MKVCYFGGYDPEKFRNKLIVEGLRQNNVEVIECNEKIWRGIDDKKQFDLFFPLKLLASYTKLVVKYSRIHEKEVIIVGYPGYFDVFLAKFLTLFSRKPVVLDAFISVYDTMVLDRKLVKQGSLKARLLYLMDKAPCSIADLVLLDTDAHIDFFSSSFKLKKGKFKKVLVGTGHEDFKYIPTKRKRNFTAIFFGSYIPLHGIEYIIGAAKLLEKEKIDFIFIGTGQLLPEAKKQAEGSNNIFFIEKIVSPKELSREISCADICLGIFGNTDKAKRVIPHKIYVAMALKKPIITADTMAIRELLTNKKDVLLCKTADSKSLAGAILKLKKDFALKNSIAKNAFELYKEKCTSKAIGRQVKDYLLNIP